MDKTKLLLFLFLLTVMVHAVEINVIPFPNDVVMNKGECDLSDGFRLKGDKLNQDYLKKLLVSEHNLSLNPKGTEIRLRINKNIDGGKEAYRLTVTPSRILIDASAENGIFYGIQTLRQLIQQKKLPCLVINDKPAFTWRAYMLDEARYFQGKETVMQLLEEMAMLKLNTFHWHLTDDAGWRIEIKKYPQLTGIGSVRDSTQINVDGKKWKSEVFDGRIHKGYYTQSEIKELVAFASERYITIIPEISMPGHASAAVASYPWLGMLNEQIKVPVKFGVAHTVFNPANPEVIQFLHNVLKEVSGLFPSQIIHIGGDEVKYDQWKGSLDIAGYMEKNNLNTLSDVQVKFTNDISNFVSDSLGKRMMGWNEILGINVHEWSTAEDAKAELSSNAVIHFWKGAPDIMKRALEKGYNLVNSNHKYTYLDYTYEQIDLLKAYNFNPIPDNLPSEQRKQILGLGCQMWGEWTPTKKEVEYQTYPRIAAYAETGWTAPEKKDYTRFKENLSFYIDRWFRKGYNYAPLSKTIIK